jgi:DNA-binding GntR family transcriptional regulator
VRDALRALERDGLVESGGRRGKFVAMVSPHDAWEVYTLRAALEGMAFHLAAGQVSESALAELTAIVEEMRQRSRAADVEGLARLDTRFHETVCRLAGNRRLHEDWLSMSKQIRHLSGRVVDTLYSHLDDVPTRHAQLVSALQEGDPATAEAAVRGHIESVSVRIIEALRALEQKRVNLTGSESL